MPKKNPHQLAWEKSQAAEKKQRLATQAKLKKVMTAEQYTLMIDMLKVVDTIQTHLADASDVWMSDVKQLTNIWYGFGNYKNGVREIIWRSDDD